MMAEHNLRLYRAINSCIRFIYNVKADEHITLYYEKLKWFKIDSRRAYFVGCLLYKILQTKQPSLLHSNFNCKDITSDRVTRAPKDILIQPQCRTELFKRSFRLSSARLWNGLPSSIRNARTLTDFKRFFAHLLVCASSWLISCLLMFLSLGVTLSLWHVLFIQFIFSFIFTLHFKRCSLRF